MSARRPTLWLDGGLVDQHDGDVVFDRVDSMALLALQALGAGAVFEFGFAGRTHEDFEEFPGEHDFALYDRDDAVPQNPSFRTIEFFRGV